MNKTRASEKDQHTILFHLLEENYNGLLQVLLKLSATAIIALGWLVSSVTAQHLIMGSRPVKIAVTVAVLTLEISYVLWVYSVYAQSNQLIEQIRNVDFMAVDLVSSRVVTRLVAVSVCIPHSAILTLIVIIMWTL